MPEVFRKGAHVVPLKAALSSGNKFTIKHQTDVGQCFFHAKAFSNGDVVMIKPRGSPNIWKIYMMQGGRPVQVAKHKDEDAAAAYARLLYGH